jgi:hypothetical protein
MPAITIQQAYALSLRAYISLEDKSQPVFVSNLETSLFAPTINNRLQELLNNTPKDLGFVQYLADPGTPEEATIVLIGNPLTPSGITYSLVSTSSDLNSNGILDYLEGGVVDNNNTLSTVEKWLHITGLGIMKKIKK